MVEWGLCVLWKGMVGGNVYGNRGGRRGLKGEGRREDWMGGRVGDEVVASLCD